MGTPNTVFARMKKTGYIMGPGHPFAREEFSADAPDKGGSSAEEPPNFRDADGPESCGECAHYDAEAGQCQKYNYPTTANMVCDSFTPEGEGDGEEAQIPEDANA